MFKLSTQSVLRRSASGEVPHILFARARFSYLLAGHGGNVETTYAFLRRQADDTRPTQECIKFVSVTRRFLEGFGSVHTIVVRYFSRAGAHD